MSHDKFLVLRQSDPPQPHFSTFRDAMDHARELSTNNPGVTYVVYEPTVYMTDTKKKAAQTIE